MKLPRIAWTTIVLIAAIGLTLMLPMLKDAFRSGASSPAPAHSARIDPARAARISENYGKLPMRFEAGRRETGREAPFISRGQGYQLALSAEGATIALDPPAHPGSASPALVRMKLVNANRRSSGRGLERMTGVSNYFLGNDPAQWRTEIPHFAKVEYEDVWPGVDLVYYGNQRELEYDFVVAPGADLESIALDFEGAERIEIDDAGDLVLDLAGGRLKQHKPILYQQVDGERREIRGRYRFLNQEFGTPRVGFEAEDYDRSRSLVIDPVLSYSTFLGGSLDDEGHGISVDAAGNAYVTGAVSSGNFPLSNPIQGTNPPRERSAYVSKLSPDGSQLLYSTYLGGSETDVGYDIVVDAEGNAWVTGATRSTDFPVKNPIQAELGGFTDAFVTKLNPSGSQLLFSTFLGGGEEDGAEGIAMDAAGAVYITGFTRSTNFPTKTPLQQQKGAGTTRDVFVSKLNSTGSTLVYSTYLGGSNGDEAEEIAVDAAGNAYVTGDTYSDDFPTLNPFQATLGGSNDAFVSKINAAGSALVYSTYLGGKEGDEGRSIAVDQTGAAYVTGRTDSAAFPVKNAFQGSKNSEATDSFVTKFNATGAGLVYSTFLGGSSSDYAYGIAVDNAGNAWVTGSTESKNFPIVKQISGFTGEDDEVFITELNDQGSALLFSTLLGGSTREDIGVAITVDNKGGVYVVGESSSTDFRTEKPFQGTLAGVSDAIVVKLYEEIAPPSSIACKPGIPNPGNVASVGPNPSATQQSQSHDALLAAYGQLPLSFEANRGQTDAEVKFLARGDGYNLYLTPGESVVQLQSGSSTQKENRIQRPSDVLRMKLAGANQQPRIHGREELPAKSNYFLGANQRYANISHFAKVAYEDVYPGVDMVYYGNQRRLEYDLIVAPGADPNSIKLKYEGAEKMDIDAEGNLALRLPGGEIRQHKPILYQEIAGERKTIKGRYTRKGRFEVGFQIGSYDRRRPLVIDPVLSFSTYLGGLRTDEGYAIAVDSSGAAYVTGRTFIGVFPTVNPPLQGWPGDNDFNAFITKINPAGTALVYSTYLGGLGTDEAFGIAVDGTGAAYVTGRTFARDFPLVNQIQPYPGDNSFSAFVAKISPSGGALLYSTYLGGGALDEAYGIAVNAAGNAYITGRTFSQNFPTVNAAQGWPGDNDFNAFVAKLDVTGKTLLYSTYLGGLRTDEAFSIAVDPADNAYVTGRTFIGVFPTVNPVQGWPGDNDFNAFVTKYNPNGVPVYSTYLGGLKTDCGCGIAVDPAGGAYVTGFTFSQDFPTVNAYQEYPGDNDFNAFATKINPSGAAIYYSTYLGGLRRDEGHAIAVDSQGNAYITGRTFLGLFPSVNPIMPWPGDNDFNAFVTKLNAGGAPIYSTLLGGLRTDEGYGIAADVKGHAYVTGRTFIGVFPTLNPIIEWPGDNDFNAFVVKIVSGIDVSPASINFGGAVVGDMLEKTIDIREVGGDTHAVQQIVSSNPQFSSLQTTFPMNLPPHRLEKVTLRFIPTSVGPQTATMTIKSTDPTRPNINISLSGQGLIAGSPQIEAETDRLDFGAVATGDHKDLPLSIRRSGTGGLLVKPIASNNPQFSVISPAAPFSIGAGGHQTIMVRFSPLSGGAQTGKLAIPSNAANLPVLEIAVTGTGAGDPDIRVSPEYLDFGDASPGQTVNRGLEIRNPGTGALRVFAVSSSNPAFIVKLSSVPVTVPAGGSVTLPALFAPTSAGRQNGVLLISSSAVNKPSVAVDVRGGPIGNVLATDDGTPEAGVLQDGLVIVNRLTPASYPATLRSLRIFIAQFQGLPSPAGESIRLVVFEDPTGAGQPPANAPLLLSRTVVIPQLPAGGGYIDFPIDAASLLSTKHRTLASLTIDSGDLYVGYQAPSPARGVAFAGDVNGPQQQRAFFSSNNGGAYTKLGGVQNSQGDITPVNVMVQGVVGGAGVCAYAITPPSIIFTETGGDGAVTVTTSNGCSWSTNSQVDWISFSPGGAGGSGSGVASFKVAPGANSRQAVVAVAGQPLIVGQAEHVASVSSASYRRLGLAGEAIAAAYGNALAGATESAASLPLPTQLGGTTVKIKDAAGNEVFAPLFFVSPNQVNFLMPPGLSPGLGSVTILKELTSAVGALINDVVAPGLFTANVDGLGVPAAVVLRYRADGAQLTEAIATFDADRAQFVPAPIDLGPEGDHVFILLFGTGLRGRSSLARVSVVAGGVDAPVVYAGSQGDFSGLDQINVRIPRALLGRGVIDLILTVDGKAANPVKIHIK